MDTSPHCTGSVAREHCGAMKTDGIHPAVRVGHVHLKVADLDRALAFYRDVLGLGVTADGREHGVEAVFLAAGDYHHHIAINTFESADGAPRPVTRGSSTSRSYPDREELGRAVRRLLDHHYPVDHATDHGGTVSVYLADPDGNGVELYYDRPRAEWFDADGRPVVKADPIDYEELVPKLVTT
jgi:catechol 2,3-dioxygenase